MTDDQSRFGEIKSFLRARLARDRMGGRVARGAFRSILVNGTGAAVSFGVQILLANLLGEDEYGVYALALGWLSVALIIGKLELDTTSVRFVGSYLATSRWSVLRGFLRGSRRAVLLSSLLVGSFGAIVLQLFPEPFVAKHPVFPGALLVTCAMLPVVSLLLLESSVLQGFQQYAKAQLGLNVLRPVAFGAAVLILVFFTPKELTAPTAIALNMFGATLALFLTSAWRIRSTPAELHGVAPEYDVRTWSRTAYPLIGVSLAQIVISHQSDVIVVGQMLGTVDVAHYSAASQLTVPLVMAASSITFVAQPMIADLYARKEMARLQSLIRVVTWAACGVALPTAAVLIGLGPWLLRLYSPSFEVAHPVLVLLTLAQLVVGLVGALAGYLLTMTSHQREAAWIIGLSALLNVGLAVVLTPALGVVGTASATLIASVVRAIVLSIYIRRTMGLRLPAF